MDATLCTFHCGSASSLSVLSDWSEFLGGSELSACVATLPGRPGNFLEADLLQAWPNAQMLAVDDGGLCLNALDPAAIFEVVEAARSEWVLLVKLDTVPFCVNPSSSYICSVVEKIEGAGHWGATGSFIPPDLERGRGGLPLTARYSNNYSLFRRDAWLDVVSNENPDLVRQIRTRQLEPASRFMTEATIEKHLKEHNKRMLFLEDSLDRSVFHINQWESELLCLRERYRRRVGVKSFLNIYSEGRSEPWVYPAWERYYGWPKPNALRRLRISAGRARRRLLGS